MRVKATVSFAGAISMHTGQELDIEKGEVLDDLLRAGYVQEIVPEVKKKGVKADETKRSND